MLDTQFERILEIKERCQYYTSDKKVIEKYSKIDVMVNNYIINCNTLNKIFDFEFKYKNIYLGKLNNFFYFVKLNLTFCLSGEETR